MFKHRRAFIGVSILIIAVALVLAWAADPGVRAQDESPADNHTLLEPTAPLGTAFTYQGQLTDDGGPATGPCNFRFALYDAASVGTQVGTVLTHNEVALNDGRFTVILDFGVGVFSDDARWLDIDVKCAGDSSYVTLGRQALTAAPYALALPGLWTQPNPTSPNLIGGYHGNEVTAGVVGATISGGGNVDYPNRVTADYATVGGGYNNEATGGIATVAGGRHNDASEDYTTVSGGSWNHATGAAATIAGGLNNDATAVYSTVSGGSFNDASNKWTTIGGGWGSDASGEFATVGGGFSNDASGYYATIAGGALNITTGYTATVGGGSANTASGDYATIGGGNGNYASGRYATIGGGWRNDATGLAATIPGGIDNEASAGFSFAAGRRAKANHYGSFVLADSTSEDFTSVRMDALRVRFNGGATFVVNDDSWVRIWSNAGALIETSTGAHLTTGGVWTNGSDREAKENFAPVDGQAVLAQLAAVPIQTWNFKAEDPAVRRMGPTAQDFSAAFGLGEDARHIATIDADGVALAAIQALYERSLVLEAENAALQGQLADMEERLTTLEQVGGASSSPQTDLPGSWSFVGALAESVELAGWWVVGGLLVAAVMVRRKFAAGGR